MHKRNTVVVVDIGTTNIKAAMGEIIYPGDLHILGICQSKSLGLRKGHIVDIENTARALENTLVELERLTGVEISSALIGFSGGTISSLGNHAVVAASNPNFEITKEDKERVLQSACNVALPPDKTIVQTIIKQFVVDGFDGVREPVGMAGSRLEAWVTLIVTATAAVQNIYRLAEHVDLKVDQLVYNPLLAAESVLLPLEKEMGVVLLDIGGGTTDVSFFHKGNLSCASVIPMGDEYLIKDLSLVLRTSWKEAACILERYGVADPELAKEDFMIEVGNIQGKNIKSVPQKNIAEIISARLLEMIEMVYAELRAYGILDRIPAGMVLTGGGAGLSGIAELLERNTDLPVRLGIPESINGITTDSFQPINASVLGGLQYINKNYDIKQLEIKGVPKIWDNITYWVKDLFR